MSPFQFPDPNIQTVVVNPATGEKWEYENGVWEIKYDEIPDDHVHEIQDITTLQAQIASLSALVTSLQNVTIEMNSRVQTLEGDHSLILE